MDSLGSSVLNIAKGFITAQAVIGAFKMGVGALEEVFVGSVRAAAEEEVALTKLRAALIQQGTATPSVIAAYEGLAKQYQQTTVFSDHLLMSTMGTLAVVGGVMPRDMDNAMKAVTNLASAFGGEQGLEKATLAVSKAAEGNITGLTRMGVVVDQNKYKSEGFSAVLDAINAKFGGQAQALAETYTGRLAQMANAWDAVQEGIGHAVVQNQTVLGLFGSVTQAVQGNTKDLGQNAQAMGFISDVVIGLVRGFALLVDAVDLVQTTYYALRTVSNVVVEGLARTAIVIFTVAEKANLLMAALSTNAAVTEMYREQAKLCADNVTWLGGAIDGLRADTKTATDASITHGNTLQAISAKATELANHLETTRGKVAALKEGTDVGSDAWNRHTTAVAKADKALEATREAMEELRITTAGYAGVISTMNGNLAGAIEWELKHGGKVEDVAVAYQVAKAQVQILDDQLKFEQSVIAASQPTWDRYHWQILNLVPATEDLADREIHLAEGVEAFDNQLINVVPRLEDAQEAMRSERANEFQSSLQDLAGSFVQLAQVSGDSFGGVVKGIGEGIAAMSMMQKSVENYGKAVGEAAKLTSGLGMLGAALTVASIKVPLFGERMDPSQFEQVAIDKENAARKAFEDQLLVQQAAVASMNAKIAESFDKVTAAGAATFGVLSPAIRAHIADLLTMNGLTDDQRTKLQAMLGEGAVDYAGLVSEASKYGITLQGLGPVFQQNITNMDYQSLLNTWDLLINAGGDYSGMLTEAAPKISELVDRSIHFGTTVPEAMRPMLEKMVEMGLLTDENGNKIDTLGGIKFADTPMVTAMDNLNDTIHDLIDTLAKVPGHLKTISDTKIDPIHVSVVFDDDGGYTVTKGDQSKHMAVGGVVQQAADAIYAARGRIIPFPGRPRGSDVVPMWATPGEGVLSTGDMAALGGPSGFNALRSSLRGGGGSPSTGSGGSQTMVVQLVMADGRVLAEATVPFIPGELRRLGVA
jgi:hypothetical protein